jgi:hypothetical protein
MWFLYVEWQTRWVPDTRPKPDGYGYRYGFLPVGTGTDTNFYPQPLCWRAGNCSTRPESDSLPSLSTCAGDENLSVGHRYVHRWPWMQCAGTGAGTLLPANLPELEAWCHQHAWHPPALLKLKPSILMNWIFTSALQWVLIVVVCDDDLE